MVVRIKAGASIQCGGEHEKTSGMVGIEVWPGSGGVKRSESDPGYFRFTGKHSGVDIRVKVEDIVQID
jgi:hypothetical protein